MIKRLFLILLVIALAFGAYWIIDKDGAKSLIDTIQTRISSFFPSKDIIVEPSDVVATGTLETGMVLSGKTITGANLSSGESLVEESGTLDIIKDASEEAIVVPAKETSTPAVLPTPKKKKTTGTTSNSNQTQKLVNELF